MKKRLIAVLMAVAMVGTLAVGCGSNKDNSTGSNDAKSADEKVLHLEGFFRSGIFLEFGKCTGNC